MNMNIIYVDRCFHINDSLSRYNGDTSNKLSKLNVTLVKTC